MFFFLLLVLATILLVSVILALRDSIAFWAFMKYSKSDGLLDPIYLG